jgi:hypothetical protein
MPEVAAPEPPAAWCPHCGYDLRGSVGDPATCPECGKALDWQLLRASPVPWADRAQRWKRLRAGMSQQLDRRQARWFHFWLAVWLTLLVAGLVWALVIWVIDDITDELHPPTLYVILAVVLPLAFLACYTATAVHTYWFHPRRLPLAQQQRALTLSYYAAAPLAWVPVGVVLAGVAGRLAFTLLDVGGSLPLGLATLVLAGAGGVLALIAVLDACRSISTLAGAVADRGSGLRLLLYPLLPLLWLGLGLLWLVLVPGLLAGLVWMLIRAWN